MSSDTSNSQNPKGKKSWRDRFLKILPAVFFLMLLFAIVALADRIRTRGQTLEAKKTEGVHRTRTRVNVVTMPVRPGLVQERISLPGVVRPWISLQVVTEVRGKILEKRIEEGRHVHVGDVLALIDSRDYQNAYDSASAAYELAAAALKRQEKLFEDQVSTQAQLDDAVAGVKTTRARLDNAALNLERCKVRAPMDGVVNRLFVEKGQFMSMGDPLAEILQIDRVKVEVGIPESDVDAVRHVEQFKITIDALGAKVFEGRHHFLARSTDNMARLYRLEIAVDNPRGLILPDMFARTEIIKRHVEDGLAVPLYALENRKEGQSVFVVKDGVAQQRPVRTGIQDGWRVQVTDGIDPGDNVVVVGQRSIDHGTPVHIVRSVDRPEALTQ